MQKSIVLKWKGFPSNWHVCLGIFTIVSVYFAWINSLMIDSKSSVEQIAGKHIPIENVDLSWDLFWNITVTVLAKKLMSLISRKNTNKSRILVHLRIPASFKPSLTLTISSSNRLAFPIETSILLYSIVFYSHVHFAWYVNILKVIPMNVNFHFGCQMEKYPMRLQLQVSVATLIC